MILTCLIIISAKVNLKNNLGSIFQFNINLNSNTNTNSNNFNANLLLGKNKLTDEASNKNLTNKIHSKINSGKENKSKVLTNTNNTYVNSYLLDELNLNYRKDTNEKSTGAVTAIGGIILYLTHS